MDTAAELRDVLPVLSHADEVSVGQGRCELRGEFLVRPSGIAQLAHPDDVALMERGVSDRRASQARPGRGAALGHHVGGVVRVGAEEEMVRIYAEAVVAAVTYEKPVLNGSVGHDPRSSVCLGDAPAEVERSVASGPEVSDPLQAPVLGAADLRSKTNGITTGLRSWLHLELVTTEPSNV